MNAATQCLAKAHAYAQHNSQHLEANLAKHANTLGMSIRHYSTDHGLMLECQPDADHRVRQEIQHAANTWPHEWPPLRSNNCFWAHTQRGAHLLRLAARAFLLKTTSTTRNDYEGTDQIDIEAQSHADWKKWKATLSRAETTALAIWRGGAIRTPTRRYRQAGIDTGCRWCDEPLASAHHFFTTCPHFANTRTNLQRKHRIQPTW